MSDRLRMVLEDLAADYGPDDVVSHVRAMWPDLVGAPYTPARKGDRVTSQEAARKHSNLNPRRFTHGSTKHLILGIYKTHGPDTALGAAERLHATTGQNVETIRKRVSDLAKVGFLYDTGRTLANGSTGGEATAWAISIEGSHAYAQANETGWSE